MTQSDDLVIMAKVRTIFGRWLPLFIILKNGGGVCSVEVEATAITLCHGKLNCCDLLTASINSNLKVPARPINMQHILHLLLKMVKIKIFNDYTVTLMDVLNLSCDVINKLKGWVVTIVYSEFI